MKRSYGIIEMVTCGKNLMCLDVVWMDSQHLKKYTNNEPTMFYDMTPFAKRIVSAPRTFVPFIVTDMRAMDAWRMMTELTESFSGMDPDFVTGLYHRIHQRGGTSFVAIPAPCDQTVMKRVVGAQGCYFNMTTQNYDIDFIWHVRPTNQILFWGHRLNLAGARTEIERRIHKMIQEVQETTLPQPPPTPTSQLPDQRATSQLPDKVSFYPREEKKNDDMIVTEKKYDEVKSHATEKKYVDDKRKTMVYEDEDEDDELGLVWISYPRK